MIENNKLNRITKIWKWRKISNQECANILAKVYRPWKKNKLSFKTLTGRMLTKFLVYNMHEFVVSFPEISFGKIALCVLDRGLTILPPLLKSVEPFFNFGEMCLSQIKSASHHLILLSLYYFPFLSYFLIIL